VLGAVTVAQANKLKAMGALPVAQIVDAAADTEVLVGGPVFDVVRTDTEVTFTMVKRAAGIVERFTAPKWTELVEGQVVAVSATRTDNGVWSCTKVIPV